MFHVQTPEVSESELYLLNPPCLDAVDPNDLLVDIESVGAIICILGVDIGRPGLLMSVLT